jgi:alpha-L-fucosidase
MVDLSKIKIITIAGLVTLLLGSCTTDSPVDAKLNDTNIPVAVSSPPIEDVLPVPSASQLEWQEAELVMFLHYGMNTMRRTDLGTGQEHPSEFNPEVVNVKQWVKVAKDAGFKYLILTAKHHDGFCLWPSEFTTHSIKNSPYKGGKGDILKELADECKEQGLKFGFYISVWDMNSPYYGTPEYNNYYRNQLKEVCSRYSDIGEIWLDGYLGKNPVMTHPQIDWLTFVQITKWLQPSSLMAIMGPDIRWVGNEDGYGTETDWSFDWSHPAFHGISNVQVWWPTECDVSIRPLWFYNEAENSQVKTPKYLANLYLKSVGRNSNLLLNVPPTPEGVIHEIDESYLRTWRKILDNMFERDLLLNMESYADNIRNNDTLYSPGMAVDNNKATFWAVDPDRRSGELIVDIVPTRKINIFRIEEPIKFGQRVKEFEIWGYSNNQWIKLTQGTTIGRSRILQLDTPLYVSKVKLVIKDARGAPAIRSFNAYFYEL